MGWIDLQDFGKGVHICKSTKDNQYIIHQKIGDHLGNNQFHVS